MPLVKRETSLILWKKKNLSIRPLVIEQHAVSRILLKSIFISIIKSSRINKYVYIITLAVC